MNAFHTCPLNGGPLSDFTISGYPDRLNILSTTEITVSADVLLTTSSTGKRENSSIITNGYSPLGRGPQKSILSSSHECWGLQYDSLSLPGQHSH